MTHEDLKQHMMLVLPSELFLIPDPAEIDRRLGMFGLNMQSMDLTLEENEPIDIYSLVASVTEQLLHYAELARNSNNVKLALKALERAVLGCFALLNMPEPISDQDSIFEDTEGLFTHRVIQDYLDDMEDLLEEILLFLDSDVQHHALNSQITALRALIERHSAESLMEDPNGMSGMPRNHGSH